MNTLIVDDEASIRLIFFIVLFAVLAVSERVAPCRPAGSDWQQRWLNNLGLSFLNAFLLRWLAPFSGTAFALLVAGEGWSIVRLHEVQVLLSIVIFVLAFDLTIYFQHRLFHWIAPLWVFHRVHHTDTEYDVTTGTRFHPLSIVVSMAIKLLLVLILGPLPFAVLVSEVLLNATSMFNHSNLKLPGRVDRWLRYVIVTPDMHRIHHSVIVDEHNHNFGFNFTLWDRIFGTYLDKADKPAEAIVVGIQGFNKASSVGIGQLLAQPFMRSDDGS